MSFADVGKRWSTRGFREHLPTVRRPTWAKSVTIHHTAAPSLAQRPKGLEPVHIENIANYYRTKLGWNRGPHFFIDEDDICGMTPPNIAGIHAASFNATSIGIEALGNYDVESHDSGRGLMVWTTTAIAARCILRWLNLPIDATTVLFHRDDPKTRKTCPGKKVSKHWFLELVRNADPMPVMVESPGEMVPVAVYAAQRTGRSFMEVAREITREGNMFFLRGSWLEGAHYDATLKTTVAPKSEVDDAIK